MLKSGSYVNLERAMTPSGRMGGHIVSGHIDTTADIIEIRTDENAIWYTLKIEPEYLKYIVEKGSVAIDGTSLTVAYVDNKSFKVSIIPHTQSETIMQYKKAGDIVNIETNEVIGKHIGLMNYTIGQRRGLDIGGYEDRMFVVGKNLDKNILYVCIGDNNDYLYSDSCLVDEFNLIGDHKPTKCSAKFRYRQKDVEVEVKYIDSDNILVKYDREKAVTPGQACVLYDGEEVIGGGIIKEVRKNGKKLWYL